MAAGARAGVDQPPAEEGSRSRAAGRRRRLLGRGAERERIDRLLLDARVGSSGVLVVSGEPGIGKTALLDHAAERAEDMEVLRARGVQSEAELPFGGLLELLRPALGELARLPEPQAASLRGALALGPPADRDRFAVGAATLNLLCARAERRPLLVLVDDAHWLDRPSRDAILFAARRLVVDPIAVVLAVRRDDAGAVREIGAPELTLAGVGPATAAGIVAEHAGGPLPPDVAERLWRLTAGNPLALVELAPHARELEDDPARGLLPAETSVGALYRRRIEALPPRARALLLLAAADGTGDLATLGSAAAALGVELSDLQEAERAGLASVAYGRIELHHPLVASAAYQAAPPGERRAAHRALAAAPAPDGDPDRRAWHLASAALGPDAVAAGELERVAARARARNAYATAARAAGRAAQLTDDPRLRARRLMATAEAAWLSGRVDATVRALRAALALDPGPRLRAELEHLGGQAAMHAGRVMDGHDALVRGADAVAPLDPAKAIAMRADASEACFYAARPREMLATARRAYGLLGPGAGERERFRAALALGTALVFDGQGAEGAARVREAVAVLEASPALQRDPRLVASAALGPLFMREAGEGAALIDRAVAAARADGALGVLPFALGLAGRHAASSGRWAPAEALYEEAMRLGREIGQGLPMCIAAAGLACLDARRGREPECREHAAEALALADRHGLGAPWLWALDALAELELGAGRPDAAVEHLERKERALAEAGIADPDVSPVPELVEAGVRRGAGPVAPRGYDAFARLAERKGQPWTLARLERCRGLLAGDAIFERHFAAALRLHARTPDRFEEARTRLCHGERMRRARRRIQARAELRAAFEAFEELGAAPWAERAHVELAATGEHARRRVPSTLDELTPQELQIGTLLAGGLTTRAAAAKLFLSPKTVEHHLRSAYRKLGVRSRDGLAEVLSGRPPPP